MGLLDMFRMGPSAEEITHADLVAALQTRACALIDLRESGEFAAGRVHRASNMPLSRFDPAALPKGKPVVLICRSGARSAHALSRAREAERIDVRHYRGGTIGWAQLGGKLI